MATVNRQVEWIWSSNKRWPVSITYQVNISVCKKLNYAHPLNSITCEEVMQCQWDYTAEIYQSQVTNLTPGLHCTEFISMSWAFSFFSNNLYEGPSTYHIKTQWSWSTYLVVSELHKKKIQESRIWKDFKWPFTLQSPITHQYKGFLISAY